MTDVPAPAVPTDRLDDWERVEASVDRLFGVEGTDVRGHTVVYEDAALRRAVREATDGAVDQAWRFFFATRLRFRPPLAPGIGPAAVLPTVRMEAVRSFRDDLRDRGIEDVERGRSERLRTADDDRVRLRQVTGELAPDGVDATVPVEGWVGAWSAADIHVAGGAYPAAALASTFDTDASSPGPLSRSLDDSRSELFDLVTNVG